MAAEEVQVFVPMPKSVWVISYTVDSQETPSGWTEAAFTDEAPARALFELLQKRLPEADEFGQSQNYVLDYFPLNPNSLETYHGVLDEDTEKLVEHHCIYRLKNDGTWDEEVWVDGDKARVLTR